MKRSMLAAIAAIAAATTLGGCSLIPRTIDGLSGPAIGQGNRTEAIDEFPLGSEIPGFEGYVMRARYIVVAPGGSIRIHTHFGRPAFSYIVSGPVTQHRSDVETPIKMIDGDLSADNQMSHWWTNDNPREEARWYVVDVYKADGNAGE
jgi:quercetin dioxygenase-like cupin family protein